MDSKCPNKLKGVKYCEVLFRVDGFQNLIVLKESRYG